ncbi:V-type ATPase subunit [Clostridium amazonitimonense]|uniref:V-type ATPase subunit n=1 Tax=Clostridium amazonitimonense TaxID=1499689 RepID=UPI00050941EA|nr:V-type ATPase subunit [Clostridium amazonitimonense]
MGSIVKFTAVNSKVKALKGKMLREEDFLELLQCKGLKNALAYLKEKTYYGEILKNYDLQKIHRGELEIILDRQYTKIFNKFINYFNGEFRKVIKNLFLRWEIEDLKIIIRGKYIGRTKEEIKSNLIAKNPLNTIDYDYLITSKSIEELIERLKGSIYYDGIKNLAKDVSDKGLFRIETELDFVYFSTLRKELKHLDKENKELIKDIIGLEADLSNLSWIYRGKKFYNISPEELFNYTIYDGYKLTEEKIKRICYANDMEEIYKIIEKTPYRWIYEIDDSITVEKREREFQKKYFSKFIRENRANFSMVLSYLVLYRIEIKEIISIVEQKRYELDIKEGAKYVHVTH